MAIYDLNFGKLWRDITPPILRSEKFLAWGRSVLEPLQYDRDLIFNDYADGSNYAIYSNASAYTTGNRVVYSGRSVYESVSGSTGIAPSGNTTTNWTLINSNYIGVRERAKYNSQKILFEYALNRNFQCSGIYIQNNSVYDDGFVVGIGADYSSPISQYDLPSAGGYIGLGYTANTLNTYTIFVPAITFSGFGVTTTQRENVVRSFADNYNLAGMIYNVLPY